MRSFRAVLAFLLFGVAIGAAPQAPRQGQSQAQNQTQQPVFRSGVDLVTVDVLVVDRDGRPVPELKAEDFRVTVDGKPRRITSVEFRSHYDPLATPPDRTAVPNIRSEDRVMMRAEYSSNRTSPPGRMIVLVIDTGNMTRGEGRGALEAARQFVQRLAPNDLVALVSVPAGVTVDFTADRTTIRAALLKVVGGGASRYLSDLNVSLGEAFALVTGSQRRLWDQALREECVWARTDGEFEACRMALEADARAKFATARASAESSERALEIALRRLSLIDGQKHLIFIGQSLVTGSSYGLLDGVADLAWIGNLVHAARINLYVLHLDRAFLEAFDVKERFPTRTPLEDAHLLNDGLAELAGQSGGAYFNLTTAFDKTFERIARETSASYLLTFEPTEADRDGKAHGVGVKVARPDVQVRARKQFTVDAARNSAPIADRLSRVLNSPYLPAVVPVDMTTYVVGGGDGSMRVLLAAEIGCGSQAAAEFDVGHIVTNAAGEGKGSPVQRPNALFQRQDGTRCVYYTSSFSVKTGEYAVRAVAMDPRNKAGGVERHLDARLTTAGPFGLSSLVLTDPALRVDGKMKLVVDGRVGGSSVAAYLEMRRLQPIGVASPAAKPVVQFEVAGDDSSPVLAGTVPPVLDDEAPGTWYAEGTISLASLKPGTYLVRAIVLWDGAIAGRVGRSIVVGPGAGQ
jgi:VWFA-related protein